ncbi:recombinase family protein [Morganella psychrotolerans]|uniref:recombinase family protein n=1 Tax=Morganella psychrotolerans TaxID=368603 RepID=UPI0039AF5C72
MIIGYARVSSNHQDTELQMQALRAAGCTLIFEEKASGRKTNRPVLKEVVDMLEPDDELVIWKLDRIGRNVLHALLTFQSLAERHVNIRSITDGVDLSTASGRYNFRNILSAAQYESDLNSERTLAGLAVARARGRIGGRKPKFTNEHWDLFKREIMAGHSHRDVAIKHGVSLSTLYKHYPVQADSR